MVESSFRGDPLASTLSLEKAFCMLLRRHSDSLFCHFCFFFCLVVLHPPPLGLGDRRVKLCKPEACFDLGRAHRLNLPGKRSGTWFQVRLVNRQTVHRNLNLIALQRNKVVIASAGHHFRGWSNTYRSLAACWGRDPGALKHGANRGCRRLPGTCVLKPTRGRCSDVRHPSVSTHR